MVFPVINASFKEIFDSNRLNSIHSVSFTGTSLTISKNSYNTLVEYQIENRPNLEEVQLLICVMLIEGIVEFEFIIFNCFSHTIHFEATVVNDNLRIGHRDYIDFSICKLVMEYRSLFKAN